MMADILLLGDTLEPNVALFKGDLQKIAKIHVSFYKFYIRFASKCDALVFDKKSQDYLESCIDFLENKKLTKKAIQQSRSNCLKMLDSLNDLCATLGCDKKMLAGINKLIDQAVVDDEGKGGGTLDLLKQLKNLLNDPGDANDALNDRTETDGRISPASTGSSAPDPETSRSRGGVESMTQYLLSDPGMDSYYHKYNKDMKNFALTTEMNQIMARASSLRENTYSGLDNMLAKMKINVPIWNYHVDRYDTIDSSNVMENMEIFGGNKSVTDAVLYSCPEYLTVGPFDVYVRGKVFVYHCLVDHCNNCMTTSLEFLKLHVKFQHGMSDIDWNCTSCELIKLHSACQNSLDGALDHLAKCHSVKSTYTLSKERLLQINQKIVEEDQKANYCPVPKKETPPEENTDLFHCPNPECGFSTNSVSLAFGHYGVSIAPLNDALFKCRYCSLISYSSYELCEHLVREHANASYKCGYCPYRSVSKANCVYHQRDLHPEKASKILGFEAVASGEYRYTCRGHNTIKPFVCNDSCNFGTLVEQKFNQHILTHPEMTVTCHYCEKYHTDDMSDLRDHFLIHGVGEYHCLYCKEAFNFISKVQLHLHEKHPSQYPFMIICQDFESRSHSLTGKYNKVQKLDIGTESIVVLALESDKASLSVEVISESESILIEDIDHCKMQLKTFMKNKYVPEQMPYAPPLPHVEETLDLTASDDPKERVDIKPRLRVRTIEELMKSAQAPPTVQEPSFGEDEGDRYPAVATFHAFSEPMESLQPSFQVPMLTPAQIKQEKISGSNDNEVMIEREIHSANDDPSQQTTPEALIPSIQIKREVVESAKSPVKLPRKRKPVTPLNPASIKVEVTGTQAVAPSSQPKNMEKNTEDEEAVAALISQEARRRSSVSHQEHGRALSRMDESTSVMRMDTSNDTVMESQNKAVMPRTEALPEEETVSHGEITNVVSLAVTEAVTQGAITDTISLSTGGLSLSQGDATMTCQTVASAATAKSISNTATIGTLTPANVVMTSSGEASHPIVTSVGTLTPIHEVVVMNEKNMKEIVLDPAGRSVQPPLLSPASIDNIPMDFDCVVPQQDTKEFAKDLESNFGVVPRYTDPKVIDTVIISDGEDYDDVRASPVSTPSRPIPASVLKKTPPTSQETLKSPKAGPTLAMESKQVVIAGSSQQFLINAAQFKTPTFLLIDAKSMSSTPITLTPTTTKPPTPSSELPSPANDTRRYRCKICHFASEDRDVTLKHLSAAHPTRFSQQVRQVQSTRPPPAETIVRAVSCPYCPNVVYEGIKSFQKHHLTHHSDFSEVKCFLVYNPDAEGQYHTQVFACSFCGHFCHNEEAVWKHIYASHAGKVATMKKPLVIRCTVALKKMVCPLYNCLDEFLDPSVFRNHVDSHSQVIACKKCTYIADSIEEFQKFHMKIDPDDRVDHFYFTQSPEMRANLLNVQRFSNPLYSLSQVYLRDNTAVQNSPVPKKTTARKSTGGAQYK